MKRPKISICIPTYNRAKFLNDLLLNITNEISASPSIFEVVVIDNNSDDETCEVVNRFKRIGTPIKYVKRFSNLGAIFNIANSVDYCDGVYTQLIGDDDLFSPGTLNRLIEITENYQPDIILSDRFLANQAMDISGIEKSLNFTEPMFFDFKINDNFNNYFSNTISMIGIFSFISNITVKTSAWRKCNYYDEIEKSYFPHAIKIMDIINVQSGSLLYLPEPRVIARLGNDDRTFINFTEYQLWNVGFSGLANVGDIFYNSNPQLYELFMTPISAILRKGVNHYLEMAANDGQLVQALGFVKRLNLVR